MRAVHLLRHEHAIITLCRVLNVNRSSYYKHFNSKEPKRAIENRNIKNCILQIYSEAKCRYGAKKMRKVLEVNYGIHIRTCPHRVRTYARAYEYEKSYT